MARFMPALHIYWEVRILPYEFPIVWGVGQVARGDFALDARLNVTGKSDSGLKASVASLKPADRTATKLNRSAVILNEVFIM